MLVAIETHPIQYHAPVFRALQNEFDVPVTVIYGSDFSVAGYYDREFRASFAWDTDLLSGYAPVFLSQVSSGGPSSFEDVSASGLRRVLRGLSPKAVVIAGYGHRYHRAGFYAAWRNRVPILFRAETSDPAGQRGVSRRLIRDATLRWWYQRCAKLLFIGERSLQHYRRLGVPPDQLVFSPYCVDNSSFETTEQARQRLRLQHRRAMEIGDRETVLLFSGKLTRRKGPDLLLRAIKQMDHQRRERIRIVFVGNGELKAELQSIADRDPRINLLFAGFQNQKELSPYYHAADLLVLPSRHSETWGLVINEALAHGLPCVVSDNVGCAADLIEPGVSGEVFETDSVESLVSAIDRCLCLTQRPDVREQCRNKVANYTVSRAAQGIAEAYRAVTRNHVAIN
jgi:glycosyltransferase involved in cell wall biosynthesis